MQCSILFAIGGLYKVDNWVVLAQSYPDLRLLYSIVVSAWKQWIQSTILIALVVKHGETYLTTSTGNKFSLKQRIAEIIKSLYSNKQTAHTSQQSPTFYPISHIQLPVIIVSTSSSISKLANWSISMCSAQLCMQPPGWWSNMCLHFLPRDIGIVVSVHR